MSDYIILNDGTDRDSWLEARRPCVTATEAAKIHRGGTGAWAAIRDEKRNGGTLMDNVYMQHGRDREPVLAEFAAHRYGLTLSRALFGRLDRPEDAATPDALNESTQTLGEFKTTKHDWDSIQDVPVAYIDQMDWQMHVMGFDRVKLIFEPHQNFVPLYFEPKVFEVVRDQDRIDALTESVEEYRQWVSGEDIPRAAEIDRLATEIVQESQEIDYLATLRDAKRASLRDLIAETHGDKPFRFEGSSANVTLSIPKPTASFSSTAFKKAHPDQYAEFVEEKPSTPRLTITPRS